MSNNKGDRVGRTGSAEPTRLLYGDVPDAELAEKLQGAGVTRSTALALVERRDDAPLADWIDGYLRA